MNNQFLPLHCDDDVIQLQKDAFKVSRLKELISQEVRNKLRRSLYRETPTQDHETLILGFLSQLNVAADIISLETLQFNAVQDCHILQVGGKLWQKGKLKIEVFISPNSKNPDVVNLEFCSTEAASLATV
jgi:hypothetical protein